MKTGVSKTVLVTWLSLQYMDKKMSLELHKADRNVLFGWTIPWRIFMFLCFVMFCHTVSLYINYIVYTKNEFCHHLHNLKLFQTCMTFFFLWNIKVEIWRNVSLSLCVCVLAIQTKSVFTKTEHWVHQKNILYIMQVSCRFLKSETFVS